MGIVLPWSGEKKYCVQINIKISLFALAHKRLRKSLRELSFLQEVSANGPTVEALNAENPQRTFTKDSKK